MNQVLRPRVMPATVLVDARGLQLSGIGRYLREVLTGLLADDRFGRFRLLGEPGQIRAFADDVHAADRIEVIPAGCRYYAPGVHARMAGLALTGRLRADVAFFPHYDVPFAGPLPSYVMTVHDLGHFALPELFPRAKRTLAAVLMARAVARARSIMADSSFTASEVVRRFPRVGSRVVTVPLGVSRTFEAAGGVLQPRPYLLCVGNRKPHKNLTVAVEVLSLLRTRHPDLRLVIAGPTYADDDPVRRAAARLGVSEAVVDVGAVDDEELRDLYRGAACFLFPSRYEGFGLPVLEAMSAGSPVVASRCASVPEVVGEAGLLVNPDDPDEIARSVERVLEDPVLRTRLVELGRSRAREFSWERTVRATADLLFAAIAPESVR
jgi:glycosyltransferase involved in cell wall biosynthesis